MLLKEIFGKKIINSKSAKYEGIVVGAVVSRTLKYLSAFKVGIIYMDNGVKGQRYVYIDPACIFSFKDALITETIKEIPRPGYDEAIDAPLNVPVFNQAGLLYGYLIDMRFNRSFQITKLVYDRPFGIQKIISISEDVIVAKAAHKKNRLRQAEKTGDENRSNTNPLSFASKVKFSNAAPPIKHTENVNIAQESTRLSSAEEKTYALISASDLKEDEYSGTSSIAFIKETNANPSQSSAVFAAVQNPRRKYPKKLIGDYTFLLGRTVGDDIKNPENEVLIAGGEVITDSIVEKAGAYGKLVELTFSSLLRG
ncbi:MAG: hypothetical protein LBQ27_03860 [Clostridiales bacterium]|jgi:hypothetical protein|nr:hypothetical protein [Clostridiales bacterium]